MWPWNIVSLGILFTALQHAYKRFVQSQSYSRRGHFYFISGVLIRMRKQLLRCKYWQLYISVFYSSFSIPVLTTNLERDMRIWGEKWEILSVFQGIIHGLYRKWNLESRPQMHVVFFYNAVGWKELFHRYCYITSHSFTKCNVILLTSENRKWLKMYNPFSQNDG